MNKKRRAFKTGFILFVAVLVIGIIVGYQAVKKEHREIMNLSFDSTDFNNLNNGVFIGEFNGGMYGWRKNKVQVTVINSIVKDIILLEPTNEVEGEDAELLELYKRVIENQSLDVDAISGATISSKGYLKAIDNAITQAKK